MNNTAETNNKGFLYISDTEWKGTKYTEDIITAKSTAIVEDIITKNKNIVINIEAKFNGCERADHALIDVVLLLLCHKYDKTIICVGFEPLHSILSRRPQDVVLCAPGVRYIQLPCDTSAFNFVNKEQSFSTIKPFLKPRVDTILAQARHSYANYAGMYLMLLNIYETIDADDLAKVYPELNKAIESPDFKMLHYYYGFDKFIISEENNKSIECDSPCKFPEDLMSRRILLVDDMADQGWQSIVGEMIYDDFNKVNIAYLHKPDNGKTWEKCLQEKINVHKPHLILLDLRLEDEKGKKELKELMGYKLLKWLKKHDVYKGIPVVMFTATTNADNVKELLALGAEAVWTKPGLDEEMTIDKIKERYESLLDIVKNVLYDYYGIVTPKIERQIMNNNFENIRINLYKKFSNLSYRIKLFDTVVFNNDFNNGYDQIFIDTNVFITKTSDISFIESFCNLFILAHICGKTKYNVGVEINGNNEDLVIETSKIVVLNDVVDELYKNSKNISKKDSMWKYALLSYDIFRGLFDKEIIRTEINAITENHKELKCHLNFNKHFYADDVFINELKKLYENLNINIHNLKQNGNIEYSIYTGKYSNTKDYKTLIITDDKGLRKRINDFMKSPNGSLNNNITILKITDFNNKMKAIRNQIL